MVKGNNSLYFSTGLDNSGLRSGAKEAGGIVSGLASTISAINPFAALAIGAATIFAGIAKEAFAFAKKYEQAMLEVKTISKSVQNDFSGSKSSIFKLSQETLDDPVELAKAYYQVVSAGYDGAEGLRLLEVASKAATAGVTDTLTAADGLTTVMNAFQVGAEDAESVADALFKTVELGKTTFAELSASLSTAAPLASALGVSYNEVLAAVASLTKQGVPTSQAMTQIRAALIGVNKELGDGFSNAYTFQEAMQEVADRAGGSTAKLQESLGTIEAVGAVLATTGKNAKGAADDLEEVGNAAGAANKAFQTMASGTDNSLSIIGNRIRALTESLGEDLLSAANDVAGAFLRMTDSATNFKQQSYQDEIDQLAALKQELESVSTSQERRKEIIDLLQQRYPAFLGNIKNEGELTQELTYAIQDVNTQLLKRYQLAGNQVEIQEIALSIGEKEKEQKAAIIQLERELQNIESAAFRDRISYLEQQQGRELSYLEKSEEAFKLLGKNVAGVGLAFNKVRDAGKELIPLRKQFNELTGASDELNESVVDFGSKSGLGGDKLAENLDKSEKTYAEFLDETRNKYKAHEDAVVQLGQNRADELNAQLLKQADTYRDFLQKQLEEYKGATEKEKDIAAAAQKAGFRGLFQPKGLQKVKIEVLPSVQDIELSSNAIQKLIRELEKEVSDSGALFDPRALTQIGTIAQRQISELTKINSIKRLKEEELAKFRGKLSKEQLAERTREIEEQNRRLMEGLNSQTEAMLRDVSQGIFDATLGTTELSFQNLNAATLGQLNQIEDKIRDIKINSQDLIELGIDESAVDALLEVFEKMRNEKLALTDTAQAQKIGDIFGTVGDALSQASDDLTRNLGSIVSSLGNVIATFGDANATGLQKASGLVGLIIQAGGLLREIGKNEMNAVVDAQKEVNQNLFKQIELEQRVNNIRRERQEIVDNSSSFLDSYYKEDFVDALDRQAESEQELNRAMEALSKQGIFTASGTGQRLLFGSKTEDRDFSIEQILGDFNVEDYFSNNKSFFDPLSIFGGFADQNVSKDALANLRTAFDDTFEALGITAQNTAELSTDQWLDFFRVMEEGGFITDEATKTLLDSALSSLDEYRTALESMRDTIKDFAGSLRDDLTNAIVTAFESGGNAAEEFQKSINSILQNLFLTDLVQSQFKPYFDRLQDEMEKSFSSGGDQSWLDDIKSFAGDINPLMEGAAEAFRAFNESLGVIPENLKQEVVPEETKPELIEPEEEQGLSKAVSGITQDTATILAGTMNAIRVDTRAILDSARVSSIYMSNIEVNTRATVSRLEGSNQLLTEIRNRL